MIRFSVVINDIKINNQNYFWSLERESGSGKDFMGPNLIKKISDKNENQGIDYNANNNSKFRFNS